jgi:peptide/nickel transport system ATP-binding protein
VTSTLVPSVVADASGPATGRGEAALSVERLKAYYRTRHFGVSRDVTAVDDVSFEVRRNEIYGLAGESSSGKTTLIKTIAGLVRPPLEVVAGTVRFRFLPGHAGLHLAPEDEVERIRWRNLSYIMQGSMSVLNPVRRIGESFRDFAFKHMGLARRAFDAAVVAHLARLGLEADILHAYPHELSGGMRQRVTIALSTICRPEFIIADEPTTALDVVVQKDVLDTLRSIQREMGSSLLFVTHDMGVHAYLTDRLGIMYAGRLVEEGRTQDIFVRPLHPYTRHLVTSLPRIGDDTPRHGLEGRPPNLADPPRGCRFHPRCPLAMEICRTETPPMLDHGTDRRVACFAVEKAGAHR